jgi:hypothetical protein
MRFLSSLLLAVTASAGFAQSLPSAPHLTVTQKSTFLLMNDQVRAKVGLGAAEIKAYMAASDYRAKNQQKLMTAKEPLVKEMAILDTTYADKVWKSLTASHRQALLGLALDQLGVDALSDKEIAAKIGLTKAQSNKIAGILAEKKKKRMAFDEMVSKGLAYAQEGERDQVLKSYDAERRNLAASLKTLDAKVLATLTAVQAKKWKAL